MDFRLQLIVSVDALSENDSASKSAHVAYVTQRIARNGLPKKIMSKSIFINIFIKDRKIKN